MATHRGRRVLNPAIRVTHPADLVVHPAMSVIHHPRAVMHPDPHAVNPAARGEDHRASVRRHRGKVMQPANQVAQRNDVVLNSAGALSRTHRARLARDIKRATHDESRVVLHRVPWRTGIAVTIPLVLRRIIHYVRNTLTALSLPLCVASVGLWIASYRYVLCAGWANDPRATSRQWRVVTASERGSCIIGYGLLAGTPPSYTSWADSGLRGHVFPVGMTFYKGAAVAAPPTSDVLGFGKFSVTNTSGGPRWTDRYHAAYAPHWFIALLFASLPGRWAFIHWRAKQRALIGHCKRCGYDLRATPDRCPECGTEVGKVTMN